MTTEKRKENNGDLEAHVAAGNDFAKETKEAWAKGKAAAELRWMEVQTSLRAEYAQASQLRAELGRFAEDVKLTRRAAHRLGEIMVKAQAHENAVYRCQEAQDMLHEAHEGIIEQQESELRLALVALEAIAAAPAPAGETARKALEDYKKNFQFKPGEARKGGVTRVFRTEGGRTMVFLPKTK